MKNYPENMIGKNVPSYMDLECRKHLKLSNGWLPFETYDLVQSGYPYPDHGEMILRSDGGTNKENELLPAKGMWAKVEDIKKYLKLD